MTVLAVWVVLVLLVASVLAQTPWSVRKGLLMVCVIGAAAWSGLCVANAAAGFALLIMIADPVRTVFPGLARDDAAWAPTERSAIAVMVRREDMAAVLPPLRHLMVELDKTSSRDMFDVFVLSDTPEGVEAQAEAAAVARLAAADRDTARVHYRRRTSNDGFKAGNLMAFLDQQGDRFFSAVVLDADSKLSAAAARRLMRALEDDRALGLVQHLTVGTPARAALPRLFQFGMRAGMRVWAVGQAWWQDDEGPYWGHNAALRVTAFRAHARLAPLPDGTAIMSHDQVEAAQLRGAGWGVRVLPTEDGSAEDNPPALPEFIRRDLRWMAGNLQYRHLLRQPGLRPMGRWQLLQAILLFAGAPFHTAALALVALGVAVGDAYSAWSVTGVTAAWLGALYAPKLLGYVQVLLTRDDRMRYGGAGRFAGSALLEVVFTLLLDAIMAFGKTLGMIRLLLGARPAWLPQNRTDRGISWAEAARLLWPQTLFGCCVMGACVPGGWGAMLWALPLAGGLVVAIPFCVVTSSRRVGAWLARAGVAAVPEEVIVKP